MQVLLTCTHHFLLLTKHHEYSNAYVKITYGRSSFFNPAFNFFVGFNIAEYNGAKIGEKWKGFQDFSLNINVGQELGQWLQIG